MSDKEKLVALLEEFGVGFVEEQTARGIEIVCEQGASKVGGYGGFVTIFKFSVDGEFLEMGAWE